MTNTTPTRGAYRRTYNGHISYRNGEKAIDVECVVCGKARLLKTTKSPLPACVNGCDPTDQILQIELKENANNE